MTNKRKDNSESNNNNIEKRHGNMNRFIYGSMTGSRLVGNKKKRKVIGMKK